MNTRPSITFVAARAKRKKQNRAEGEILHKTLLKGDVHLECAERAL